MASQRDVSAQEADQRCRQGYASPTAGTATDAPADATANDVALCTHDGYPADDAAADDVAFPSAADDAAGKYDAWLRCSAEWSAVRWWVSR